MNKSEVHTVIAIGLLYVVRMLGLFMVLPVLPLVGDELGGVTPLLIGIAIGAYGLSQAILQIPLGLLSDRIGRKPVIFAGLAIFVLGGLLAGITDNIYGVIAGRFLQGCGAISSTLLALVSDVTRVEYRARAMAVVGMSIGFSFAAALILGPLLAAWSGIAGVFLFAAGAGVVGILLVATMVPASTVRSHNPQVGVSLDLIGDVLGNSDLRRTTAGVFMLHYLLMSSFIVFPLAMRATGTIADADHHWVYFWLLLLTFILMGPFMWFSDRPGATKPMLLAMISVFVVSSLLLSGVNSYIPVLISMGIFFMAFNLLEVIMPALVSKVAPIDQRGTAMGVYSTAQFAGGFAGGGLGGFIVSAWDISFLMYVNAAICIVWFLYSLGLSKPGNYRTVTCRLSGHDQLSASQVADALLSVAGVLDVALIQDERLAYLKVDNDRYDEEQLTALGVPAATVVSH